jgi:hypothetical protein
LPISTPAADRPNPSPLHNIVVLLSLSVRVHVTHVKASMVLKIYVPGISQINWLLADPESMFGGSRRLIAKSSDVFGGFLKLPQTGTLY